LENYQLHVGEESSWASYDKNGEVVTQTTPDSLKVKSYYGKNIPGGSQVFPGFRPANETNAFRTSYAGYLDLEADLTEDFMLSTAVRYENYSDFGSTFNYKLATRYDLPGGFAIRAAASTGFRAPSLHQIYFNATATQFLDGIPYEVGTFSNSSRAAQLFGIPKLKEETSKNYSLGLTGNLESMGITFTLDAYMIKINDRVVLTEQFKKPSKDDNPELWQLFENAGATTAKFFANAVNTTSKGIDIVINHNTKLGSGRLNTSLAATFSKNEVDKDKDGNVIINHVSEQLKGLESTFFGERNQINMENAMPNTKVNLTFTYAMEKFNFMLRNVYFGEVTDPDFHKISSDPDVAKIHSVYGGKELTDFSVSYGMTNNLKLTFGANNLLDIYPDLIPGDQVDGRESGFDNTYGGQFVYSRRTSQFGFMGRFVFGRVTYKL
jgi:iron complex outermembrane receptor protein